MSESTAAPPVPPHHGRQRPAQRQGSATLRSGLRLSPGYLGLLVLLFGAPFSVSGFLQSLTPGPPTSVMVLVLSAAFFTVHLLHIRRVRIDGTAAVVLVCLLLPMFISFAVLPVNVLTTGIDYSAYVGEKLWSRTINMTLYCVVFLAGYTVVQESPPRARVRLLATYLAALGVVILFGLWQWTSFYLAVPYPDFGSRTYLHSVSAEISALFPGRITSLASEPSFLAPLLMDAAIIGAVVLGITRRYYLLVLLPSMWLLLFTFSGGGYLNLIILVAFGFLLAAFDLLRARVNRLMLGGAALIAAAALLLHQPLLRLLAPILGRMGAFLDLQTHDRLYMVVMPFTWFSDDGPIAAIFGHGPGAFALLGEMHRLPDGGPIHVTSNNIFTDLLYEQGIVGLILIVALFAILLVIGLRGRDHSQAYLAGAVLTVHLVTTSVFRADFMAPRFWVVLLCICTLYRIGHSEAPRRNPPTSTAAPPPDAAGRPADVPSQPPSPAGV